MLLHIKGSLQWGKIEIISFVVYFRSQTTLICQFTIGVGQGMKQS